VPDFFHFVRAHSHYVIGRSRGWTSGSMGDFRLHHLRPGILASLASATAIIAFSASQLPRPGE